MILYLDTSSLVKLFVQETGSDEVHALVREAPVVATSVIAYPEACSAFARLRRGGFMSAGQHEATKADFEKDFDGFLRLRVNERIWRHAGELAETYTLRGFDSIHLASALSLTSLESPSRLKFSSYDDRLNDAARRVLGAEPPNASKGPTDSA